MMTTTPLGIDFGTVYSRIAYYDQKTCLPVMIPNQDRQKHTPSVVAVLQGNPIVGKDALVKQGSGRSETASFFKGRLGQPGYEIYLDGQTFNATELTGFVFAQLKEDAIKYLGVPVQDAVLAIPSYLSAPQREAYIEAGKMAGLNILGLIPEPIAAVLAHGLDKQETQQLIFVCNVGGGSTDASIVECQGGKIHLLASRSNNYLGGIEFDNILTSWLVDQVAAGNDENSGDLFNVLKPQVESAKLNLSSRTRALLTVVRGEELYETELSREQMEAICSGIVDQIERLCSQVLEDVDVAWKDLTGAILVGGSIQLPMVRARLEQMIGQVNVSQGFFEDSVALGAAIYASSVLVGQASATQFIPVQEVNSNPILVDLNPIKVLDEIILARGMETARIELCQGDLTNLGDTDAVDVLVISAYPDDYTPLPGSVIGALRERRLFLDEVAQHKEVDLRGAFSCWMSTELRDLAPGLGFKRLLCFEPLVRGTPPLLVGDIFRSLAPFVGSAHQVRTVAMPLVASGYQGVPPEQMLRLIVTAASHWMSIGLPLTCLKIACLPGKDVDGLLGVFKELKSSLLQSQGYAKRGHKYHLFISYSHANSQEVEWFQSTLKEHRSDLRVFFDRQQLNPGAAWQQEIFESLDDCDKVVAFYSPHYLTSKVCLEEFNIALCRHRESGGSILAPIYLYSSQLPTYMKLVQCWDCRENNQSLLRQAATELSESIRRES